MSTTTYRRIVTGIDANGKSTVVSDAPCQHLFGPADAPYLVNFWTTAALPADYRGTTDPATATMPLAPAMGGVTFRFFRVPPESAFAGQTEAERRTGSAAYYQSIGSADAFVSDGRHPGFHRTETVDFIVLLQGEVTLMLDDTDVPMQPFDVVIQRGTRHSWVNHGSETALLMAVLASGRDGTARG